MKIPTTERKYYDTGKKLNTLGAYAGALLPAAQSLQEMVKDQQEIKMDSLGVEARMKMNEATNEWRLQNQSNPNDPAALKDLQSQYDSILGEYRGQIDPMYRSQWDIRGNKLKGAFDVENQNWGFKQRQENAKNDIANSVDNFYKLAFSYGQSGDINKALADFGVSYERLLDYGAKNLSTETAAQMLKDYKSKFYASYLDGLVEKNPSQALKMLNSKEFYGILDSRDFTRYKAFAEHRQKQIYNEAYNNAYSQYTANPTPEGKEVLLKMNPKMSDKKKKELDNLYEEKLEFIEETTYTDYEKAVNAFTDIAEEDFENDDDRNAKYIEFLNKLNASENISNNDKYDFRSKVVTAIVDKEKREYLNYGLPAIKELMNWNLRQMPASEPVPFSPDPFERASLINTKDIVRTSTGWFSYDKNKVIKKMMTDSVKTQLGYMMQGDFDGAKKAEKAYKRKVLEYLNPEIAGKKEGDVVVIKGSIYKITSIDDDVVLESN